MTLSDAAYKDSRVPEDDLLRRTVDAGLRGRIARMESQAAYEFQMAGGFTQPERRDDGQPVAVDTVVWGGHFREDENDETGLVLAGLNGEDRDEY